MTGSGPEGQIPDESELERIDLTHIQDEDVMIADRVLARLGLHQPQSKGKLDEDLLSSDIWEMGKQRRAGLYEDLTPQTNADHIGRVAIFAVTFALGSNQPELKDNLLEVVLEALFHDFGEAYGKDTPHNDKILALTKGIRDKAGIVKADHRLKRFEPVRAASEQYHERKALIPIFNKAVDTYEPLDLALHTKGLTQKTRGDRFTPFARNAIEGMIGDRTVYPYGRYLLEIIARKWVDWGCPDYKRDPESIIGELEQEVVDELIQREIEAEEGPATWELFDPEAVDHEPFGDLSMDEISALFEDAEEPKAHS